MTTTDTLRTVRDLAIALISPTVYRWNETFEPPLPGEDYYLSGFKPVTNWSADDDASLYLEIPVTLWGDYIGSTVERANESALWGDHPDTFIRLSADYSSTLLVIPFTSRIDPFLFDAIVRLAHDYPLYDEDTHSQIEMDLTRECWDDYGARDYAELIGDTDSDNDALWVKYAAMCEASGTYPECESAISVYFRFSEIVEGK